MIHLLLNLLILLRVYQKRMFVKGGVEACNCLIVRIFPVSRSVTLIPEVKRSTARDSGILRTQIVATSVASMHKKSASDFIRKRLNI